jgi:hypothetical protein
MSVGLPPGEQCMDCKHYVGLSVVGEIIEGVEKDYEPTCKAFPDGIPDELLTDTVSHAKPYHGDSGVLFVPKTDK